MHGGRESNEQQPRQIQKPQIILPNSGTAISEHNYDLKPHRGIQWKSFKHLFDVTYLTQAIHRAIKEVGSGRFDGNILLGFVDKWSVEVKISGILN